MSGVPKHHNRFVTDFRGALYSGIVLALLAASNMQGEYATRIYKLSTVVGYQVPGIYLQPYGSSGYKKKRYFNQAISDAHSILLLAT